VTYFQIKGLGNDFPTFYKAGEAARMFSNPWEVNEGSQFNAYLNGPLTGSLLGLVSFLPYSIALLCVRLITLAVIPHAVDSIATLTKTTITQRDKYLLSCILLFTFPVRANLEYGQLAIIFSALLLATLRKLDQFKSPRNLFTLGFVSLLLIEYKPQVFIPLLLLSLLMRLSLFAGFLSGILLMTLSSWLISNTFLSSWLSAILVRSGQITSGDDQMSIYSLLSLSKNLSYSIAAILSLVLCWMVIRSYSSWKIENNYVFILIAIGIWMGISPFSHPTDMFIAMLIGSMYLKRVPTSDLNIFAAIFLGASVVWSNNVYICVATAFVVTILALTAKAISGKRSLLFFCTMFCVNLIIPTVIKVNPTLETNTRQALNYMCVAAVAFCLSRESISKKVKKT
jgi:hypothetical protein